MIPNLERLHAIGALSSLDLHFARAMARISGDARAEIALAAALVSRSVGTGHVCLELARLTAMPVPADAEGTPDAEHNWPPLAAWLAALRSSALVESVGGDEHGMAVPVATPGNQIPRLSRTKPAKGAATTGSEPLQMALFDSGGAAVPREHGSATTPLVLDGAGRLYLRRYWEYEGHLAAALQERTAQPEPLPDAGAVRQMLDRLFPATAGDEPDWQRIAALLATNARLCVISGGPGTGKTFTVVKILALLADHGLRCNGRAPRVTLIAPTGKAAARLREAVRDAKAGLACDAAITDAIPEDAATIHRCLGSIRGSDTHFRHDADNPLLTDVVLVDEASMVDLALMTRLVVAVPPNARLILLGDQDQLASVEAGAVLGDICNSGVPRHYSAAAIEQIAAVSGERLALHPQAPARFGLGDCIAQLTHSYRYRPQSGIGVLARAINAGDAAEALRILDGGDDVALVEPRADGALSDSLRSAVIAGFASALRATEAADRLRGFERFRVLCAHRHGRTGVELVNQQIVAVLHEAGLLDATAHRDIGRPIMVTRNDYQLELFNGDVGVLIEDPTRDGALLAAFIAADGAVRTVSPSRLPPHETVFAMSIHKSQGSEFDAVAVLLPDRISPVLSRELLYTAVTRAREKVTIYASREIISHAISYRIERASGLRERLWGGLADKAPSPFPLPR